MRKTTRSLSIFIPAIAIAGMTSVSMAQSNDSDPFNDSGPFSGDRGFVYTESNLSANSVLVFNRAANGTLSLAATVPTGGAGGGVVSVGSQGTLALSQDRRWLFVANEGTLGSEGAGSISVMERTPAGLKAVGRVSSGGTLPVSITVSRNLVYVLNDGLGSPSSPASITGFSFDDNSGVLRPIPNSTRSLRAPSPTVPAAGPIAAEIHFDNTGSLLYVAEVGTSLIDTYSINFDGTPSEDRVQKSFGNAPFAFAFDPRDNLLVTEVHESSGTTAQSAVTSYRLDGDGILNRLDDEGILNTISGSVPDFQTAACWIAITPDGRFAYAVNTGSAVISGYQVRSNGALSLLGNGVTAQTVRGPLDNAFTLNGRFMYDVAGGVGSIIGYQVEADGSLTLLNLNATVPSGSRGLVAE